MDWHKLFFYYYCQIFLEKCKFHADSRVGVSILCQRVTALFTQHQTPVRYNLITEYYYRVLMISVFI